MGTRGTMSMDYQVKVTLFDLRRHDLKGEPLQALFDVVKEAWDTVPIEYRANASWEITPTGIRAWYYRPETDDDRRERIEFERLKAKFADETVDFNSLN